MKTNQAVASPASTISPDQYKAVMRTIPATVAIVTSIHEGQRNGLTVTAVSSVSAEPPHLLVCINHNASAEILISKSGHFAVSYLGPDHEEVSKLFSQTKLDENSRFAVASWKETDSGSIVLANAIAYLDCEVVSQQSFGTHTVFVGRVLEANTDNSAALLYCDGKYRRFPQP